MVVGLVTGAACAGEDQLVGLRVDYLQLVELVGLGAGCPENVPCGDGHVFLVEYSA